MSQWTHVAGIIRVDSLLDLLIRPEKRPAAREFGLPVNPDDVLAEVLSVARPPEGSEGPVRWEVRKTRPEDDEDPWSRAAPWGYVALWGDLRDFGAVEDYAVLRRWFADILRDIVGRQLIIREAILLVELPESQHYALHGGVTSRGSQLVAWVTEHPLETLDQAKGGEAP